LKLQKASPALVETFERAFPDDPSAQRKQMFGFPAGFVNGNMFSGLFEQDLVLRLAEADRRAIVEQHGALPFEPMGRPMTGYVRAPAAMLDQPAVLREWVRRAFDYAAALPPKQPKPRKK
jgi:TfoX/Sxy family transcriptional regulator of competence genes